ncbi:MAG: DUF4421 family protein [Crocinitomicaceae bacterium]|nr:DUF4421 family protein [Crocinitomicaceae bacterium]MDG2441475.1 DUF4421 family protein [Crocinitomicaceae bacterium]
MKAYFFLVLFTICCSQSNAQESDTLPYVLFKDRLVIYSDIGFNGAPFSLYDNFPGGFSKVQYKHNLKPTMGLGVLYKWFSLRVGFGLPGHLRPLSRFGKSSYTDIGLNFNIKNVFTDIDVRNYGGFVIKDAYQWNDTLNEISPNDFRPNTRAFSSSINVWYFKSKTFRMPAVLGKVGCYENKETTWYFKGTLNFFGIGNEPDALLPDALIDTSKTISSSGAISALDLGVIPGYAYVNRFDRWQISIFGGLGGVIQSKFFRSDTLTRGFLGLAPRLDFRFIVGYTESKYFVWFVSDFDFKSIRFKENRYNQTYYSVKLVAGIRFNKRKKKKEDYVVKI